MWIKHSFLGIRKGVLSFFYGYTVIEVGNMELTENAYIFYYGIPIVILLILAVITIKNNRRAAENQILAASFILFTILFIAEWYRHLAPLTVSPFITIWITGIVTVLSLSMLMHVCVKLFEKHTRQKVRFSALWLYSFVPIQALVAFFPFAPKLEDFSRSGIWIERDAPLYFAWILSFVFISLLFDFIVFAAAYKRICSKKASRHLFTFLMAIMPAIGLLYVICLVTIPAAYMPSVSTIYMMVFLALFIMIGMQRYNLFPQFERRYVTLFERSPICKFMLNERFKIQEANEQTINYFGTAFIEGDFTSIMEQTGNMPQIDRLLTMLNDEGEVIDELIAFNDVKTGERAYLAVHAIRIEEGGEIFYYVMFRDRTIEVQQEERIRELAYYDSLTKLPNRAAFMETATKLFNERADSALVLLDLNYFKRINDEYGHAAGDAILQAVSEVLRNVIKPPHMPARLGGLR